MTNQVVCRTNFKNLLNGSHIDSQLYGRSHDMIDRSTRESVGSQCQAPVGHANHVPRSSVSGRIHRSDASDLASSNGNRIRSAGLRASCCRCLDRPRHLSRLTSSSAGLVESHAVQQGTGPVPRILSPCRQQQHLFHSRVGRKAGTSQGSPARRRNYNDVREFRLDHCPCFRPSVSECARQREHKSDSPCSRLGFALGYHKKRCSHAGSQLRRLGSH